MFHTLFKHRLNVSYPGTDAPSRICRVKNEPPLIFIIIAEFSAIVNSIVGTACDGIKSADTLAGATVEAVEAGESGTIF